MTGIKNLQTLLRSIKPELKPGEYVFAPMGRLPWTEIAALSPLCVFMEDEGTSLILARSTADARGVGYDAVFRLISLHVHSSLEAVGLTAAFASALSARGISANVVAAYYHDHILVPADKAAQAMQALTELQKS